MGIREIAKKSGVSVSTVSYALNGSSKITDETRQKVLKVAKELNYTPNIAGRTLKKQKTNIIGMYVTGFGGDFYSHVIDGVENILRKSHYELIVAAGGDRSRGLIPQKFVDGAIILDVAFPTEMIQEYSRQGNKIVVMDRNMKNDNVKHVLLDNAQGAHLAIDALNDSGIDNFFIVTGPSDSFDSQMRVQGAVERIKETGNKRVLIIPSDFTMQGGHQAAQIIMSIGIKNAGVFALNDELAVGLTEEFTAHQVIVGKDVKLIGYDNDLLGTYLTPKLTTIDYSKHHWGEVAAETLIKMIEKKPTVNTYIPTKVIHRGSLSDELSIDN